MLAAYYESAGDSSVLKVDEVPTPSPGRGQVRVKIAVSGINPTDWKNRSNNAPASGDFTVPGQDGAGVIDAVGVGVDPERVGERVWLLLAAYTSCWGTGAEYSIVPEEHAIALPHTASFELGASLGVPALTAWHCLSIAGRAAGKTVLVAGGAGAVGHAAIELARFEDAEQVITTVSNTEKAQLALDAGANRAFNYREESVAEQILTEVPFGVDRVIEVDLERNLGLDIKVAAPHAVIACYAGTAESVASVPVRELMQANISLRFMLLYSVKHSDLQVAIDGVQQALRAEALTTLPIIRYPLEQIALAHDAVQSGAVGKVVIDFQDQDLRRDEQISRAF
jgi:NADPH:quinone reductase